MLTYTLDERWLREPALILRRVPSGHESPRCYVCVDAGRHRLRVDVYADSDHYCFRDEALVVGDTLFIGVGQKVAGVRMTSGEVFQRDLDCYFGYLYPLADGALVASGCSLYRLALDGTMRWSARDLAVDGLLVRDVRDGVIVVDAEQDPPGGWEELRVSLESGRRLDG